MISTVESKKTNTLNDYDKAIDQFVKVLEEEGISSEVEITHVEIPMKMILRLNRRIYASLQDDVVQNQRTQSQKYNPCD